MLTDREVKAAQPPKGKTQVRLSDGGGLSLLARAKDKKWWVFRRTVGSGTDMHGKPIKGTTYEIGMGPACGVEAVSLKKARDMAEDIRRSIKAGRKPDEIRRTLRKTGSAAPGARTFRDVALDYIGRHEKSWRSTVHHRQWLQTLEAYAFPAIGHKAPSDITTEDVVGILEPIWSTKPETAGRVRGRIEKIIAAAKVEAGTRDKFNPATWRGHLDTYFPAKSKVRPVVHHAALAHDKVRPCMTALAKRDGLAALALRFLVLTATRTSEALGARWSEIDLGRRCWTIQAERTKTRTELRVPLSDAAMAVLDEAAKHRRSATDDAIFPGGRVEGDIGILSNMAMLVALRRLKLDDKTTAHGFRAAFRSWCADTGKAPEVAEAALNHAQDAIRAAYQRSDYYEPRAVLMEQWADYVWPQPPAAKNVAKFKARR
jgi:integrase